MELEKSAVKLKANVIPRKGEYKFGFYDLMPDFIVCCSFIQSCCCSFYLSGLKITVIRQCSVFFTKVLTSFDLCSYFSVFFFP